jgi:hypothetical protein
MKDEASLDLLIPSFYQLLDITESRAFKPGQFYFTHVVYPQEYPTILKLEKYDPLDETKLVFSIKRYSDGDEKHYPARVLNLRADEMLYIYTGKIRTVIILGYIKSQWFEAIQEVFLCAPVFSFKSRHSQEFIIELQAFMYPSLFYLPKSPKGCCEESAIRFEMIQPIMRGFLRPCLSSIDQKPFSLTKEAYWLLMNHLLKFISGKPIDERIEGDIRAYQELLLESIS